MCFSNHNFLFHLMHEISSICMSISKLLVYVRLLLLYTFLLSEILADMSRGFCSSFPLYYYLISLWSEAFSYILGLSFHAFGYIFLLLLSFKKFIFREILTSFIFNLCSTLNVILFRGVRIETCGCDYKSNFHGCYILLVLWRWYCKSSFTKIIFRESQNHI